MRRAINVLLQRPLCLSTDPQRLPVAGNRCHRCGMRVSKWRQDNDRLMIVSSYGLFYIFILNILMKYIN